MSDLRSVPMREAPFPFDTLVNEYDRYRGGYASEVYETVFSAGVEAGSRVLDIGCGTGISTSPFFDAGCRVRGLDIAPQMLLRARRRLPDVPFDFGSAEHLPYEDRSFDAAICAQAFHWFDQDLALAEITRVVRPGGVVAIWWKSIMRGDALRIFRGEASRRLGVDLGKSVLGESFPEFDGDSLENQRLRVIPWLVNTTAGEFLGYERSRARAHALYGARMPEYLRALAGILGPPETTYELTFVHYVYLATTRATGGA